MTSDRGRLGARIVALLLVAALVLAAWPGVASAATRTGGNVVVGENETVNGLTAFGGTVIVSGTVDGDMTAFAGNVIVRGEVTGDVQAFAGNVRIAGTVSGNVTAVGGNVFVEEEAAIDGSLEAAGGTIIVSGTIAGDARLAGGSITLEPTAEIDGDLVYSYDEEDGAFTNDATVGGSVTQRDDLSIGWGGVPDVGGWLFGFYGFLVNLALGAVLLLVFPGTSRRIADAVATKPLRTGGIGLLALVGIPIVLVLLLLTIVGIPLSIVGFILYAISIWVALVYGRFAIGAWLLSLGDVDNRWVSLLVGMLVVAVLVRIPVFGGLIQFLVLLLGLGAMTAVGYRGFLNRRGSSPTRGSGSVDAPDPAP